MAESILKYCNATRRSIRRTVNHITRSDQPVRQGYTRAIKSTQEHSETVKSTQEHLRVGEYSRAFRSS